MKFFHRYRSRLTFAFLLVTLIPAVIIGIYSIQVSSQSLLEQQFNAQAERIAGLVLETESFLSAAQGDTLFIPKERLHRTRHPAITSRTP